MKQRKTPLHNNNKNLSVSLFLRPPSKPSLRIGRSSWLHNLSPTNRLRNMLLTTNLPTPNSSLWIASLLNVRMDSNSGVSPSWISISRNCSRVTFDLLLKSSTTVLTFLVSPTVISKRHPPGSRSGIKFKRFWWESMWLGIPSGRILRLWACQNGMGLSL